MAVTQTNINTITAAAQGGAAATGTITITTNPANNDTVTVNGTAFTFKTSGATGNQVNIGADANATAAALQVVLAASTVAAVAKALYTVATNVVTVTYAVPGTVGNAFTLAKSGSNHAVSGAVLSGGSNSSATEYTPVATGGLLAETNADQSYEKNVLAIIALVESAITLGTNPTTNAAKARGERKLLKMMLNELASVVPTVVNTSSDDRAAIGTIIKTKVLKKYNNKNDNRA